MPEIPAFHSRRGGKGIMSSKSFPVKQIVSVRPIWDVKILARGLRGGEEEKKEFSVSLTVSSSTETNLFPDWTTSSPVQGPHPLASGFIPFSHTFPGFSFCLSDICNSVGSSVYCQDSSGDSLGLFPFILCLLFQALSVSAVIKSSG